MAEGLTLNELRKKVARLDATSPAASLLSCYTWRVQLEEICREIRELKEILKAFIALRDL